MDRLPMLEDIFESAKVATTPTIAIVSTQQKTERNNDSMDNKKSPCLHGAYICIYIDAIF